MTKNDECLLSICVPTYNRADKLNTCLTSLKVAGLAQFKDVELLVSDNCSTDDTKSVVERFENQGLPIRYIRQATNVGGEGNFWQLWTRAAGAYVWMIGDDDAIEADAISHVVARLEAKPDLLILNYSRWDSTLSRRDAVSHYTQADADYRQVDCVMQDFGPDLAFISIAVVRRHLLKRVDASTYASLSSTGFAFMYGIYIAISQSQKISFVAKPLVLNRSDSNIPYNWDNYFICGMACVLRHLESSGYQRKAIGAAKARVVRRYIFPTFKSRKKEGSFHSRSFLKVIKAFGSVPKTWLWILPLVLTPAFLIRALDSLRKRKHVAV